MAQPVAETVPASLQSGLSSTDLPRKRVAVATLGCKVNSYESELIIERLLKQGYARVGAKEEADLYIINSCTVTAEADRQSRQMARKLKRINPAAKVVMTGCFAQNNAQACADMEAVDWVVGNAAKLDIPILINPSQLSTVELKAPDDKIIRPDFGEFLSVPSDLLTGYESQSRAFIQIQQGCNQGCTFCVIHTARGPSQSFSVQTVLAQYQTMVQNAYKEVVICGVDLGAYGEDLTPDVTLAQLLRQMLNLNLDCRIRVSSIDPIHITDELIALYRDYERLCPHIHLSMQSASTLILKRMKRRSKREDIYAAVAKLREARPDLVLSADVLVGFPTETIAHFEDTLAAITDLDIAYPHVFPYSARAGTPAAKIPSQVASDEKKRRARLVRELGQRVWAKQAQKLVNTTALTIVESQTKDGGWLARRADYFPVMLAQQENVSAQTGGWATVKIKQVDEQRLIGELIA